MANDAEPEIIKSEIPQLLESWCKDHLTGHVNEMSPLSLYIKTTQLKDDHLIGKEVH